MGGEGADGCSAGGLSSRGRDRGLFTRGRSGGSPAGAGTGGSPAGAGAEGPKRGRRLPSRSKATPSIIFEFIGMVTSFLVCNGSIAGNAPPQGRSLNLVTPLEKQFNQYYGNMAECKLILKRAIMW